MNIEVAKYIIEDILEKYSSVNDYYAGTKEVFIDSQNYTSVTDEILRVFEKFGKEPKEK